MSTDAGEISDRLQMTDTDSFKQSETLFRSLIENSSDVIILNNEVGKITYASPAIEHVLGYTPEDFITFYAPQLIHPDDQDTIAQLFIELLQKNDTIVTAQYRALHKNGSWRWIEGTCKNLLTDPNIRSVVINIHDITERKQAEERQRVLNEVSEMLVSSPDHEVTLKEIAALLVPSLADYCRIAIIDEKGQIKEITANHIQPEKIALVKELFEHYKDRVSTTHGLQKLLETGTPELISVVSQNEFDSVQDTPALLTIIHALSLKSYMGVPLIARGRTIGAMTFSSVQPHRYYFHDDLLFAQELARRIALVFDNARLYREAQDEVAERRQAEAKLRQSEELYRLVVEHTADMITLIDMQGTIIYNSPSCETLLGYKPAEMTGMNAFSFNHPDDLPSIEAEFAKIFQGGIANVTSYRARRKDGSWVILAGTGSAIYNEQGQPFLIVSTSHDITQQQELEQRKDEFISMASHELKTPVTSLKGFTHILQRRMKKQSDEQALHYLARMDAQLDKLTRLINDLLDISRIQTGKLDYRAESFDLNALIQETVENVQGTTQTHRLLFQKLTEVQVSGDRDRIGQVLINLLTNAIKYSPKADNVVVRVSTDQENARVSVQDSGIGITEAEQQKIFERFYQAVDPMEKTYPGLGMGLYISKEIIKRHGGRIWVESSKGEGATFHFTISLCHTEEREYEAS